MAMPQSLENRIKEQNSKKQKPRIDDEPDDMELELERERHFTLNRQKSVFDDDHGNKTPGINTSPSVFEKMAVFRTEIK